jgi:molecular chaperone DnaK
MTKLIERNTTIPTKRTEVFTTAEDGQPSVEIHVLQGEREMASYNKTLGKFQLVDLPPAPRGVPQIEVTFDIDANGIVHVSAKDRATNKEQSMTITGQSSLPKDDIDRMVRDADAHAAEDRRRREEAEVRNGADTLVYQTDKLLREQGDKISGPEKEKVEQGLSSLKEALAGSDVEAIRGATETLVTASQEFASRLYEQAGPSAAAGGQPGGAGPEGEQQPADDEVVDAEIVDEGEHGRGA